MDARSDEGRYDVMEKRGNTNSMRIYFHIPYYFLHFGFRFGRQTIISRRHKKCTYMSICSRYSLINRWWTVLWSYNEKVLHPHLPIYPSKWVYLVHDDFKSIRLMKSSCSQTWPYIYVAKFTSIHAAGPIPLFFLTNWCPGSQPLP